MKTISCKEAVNFILVAEEGKLSVKQRISLWRHLAVCSLCKIFSVQNKMINQALTKRKKNKFTLTDQEKEQIIETVLHDNHNH